MLNALQGVNLRKVSGTKIKEGFGVKATRSDAKVVLIISRNWKSVYEWISENVKAVLFTDKNVKSGFDIIDQKSYEEVIVFEDLNCGIVELRAEELHKKYNFVAVVCLGEEDLLRCARLRKRLGIENSGQTIVSATRYRDKITMKEVLKDAHVEVPTFAPVEDVTTIIEFISVHGYPVVIKPRKGYGSVSTSIIKSSDDLSHFLSEFSPQLDSPLGLDIEKFVEGPMYHIDGVVYKDNVSISWPSCYLNFCGDFKKEKFNASYTLHPKNVLVPRLQKYIKEVIGALGGPEFFPFHAEVWHTPDDKLVLCEIASRVGGASIRHVLEAQFGVLFDRLWVQAQVHDPIAYEHLQQPAESKTPQHPSAGWIIIFPENGKLLARPEKTEAEKFDYVLKYFPIASPGVEYKTAKHSADAVAHFVVKGESEEEVKTNMVNVYKWYTENSKWELHGN